MIQAHSSSSLQQTSPKNQLLKSIVLLVVGLVSTHKILQTNSISQENSHDKQHATPNNISTDKYYTSLECARDCVKFQDDSFPGKHNMAGVSFAVLASRMRTCEYNFLHMHRYESHSELQLAAGPQVNQETCLQQLNELNGRANESLDVFHSNDIELARLLGTFGRIESGVLTGNTFWPGNYGECLRLRTLSQRLSATGKDDRRMSHRYCVARFRHKQWSDLHRDILSYRLGVCLPATCDSSNYKNKLKLVENLIQINDKLVDFRHTFQLEGLYCLPDEQSPLRTVWQTPKSAISFTFVALWLALVAVATIKHSRAQTNETTSGDDDPIAQVWRSLSVVHNLNRLLDVRPKKQTASEISNSKQVYASDRAEKTASESSEANDQQVLEDKSSSKTKTNGSQQVAADASSIVEKKFVDLSCVEGIKVISMCYVICGHVLMCSTIGVKNPLRVHATNGPFYMANMIPAFAVNAFFVITGILTSYLIFRQNHKNKLIQNPFKWIAFIAYRYLRIMPMYMLVVLYSKNLAKYTNVGPIWDYGTSNLSHRRICEQESWLWTMLFAANFKKPLDHCIPGGWYLANDFQFSLVTPIFLVLLYKSPNIGKLFLHLSICISFIACFLSIFLNDLEDFRSIANFEPHGFKTYVTYLSHNYTRPYYRIPAYLCGLYMGYLLYDYEQKKINHYSKKMQRNSQLNNVVNDCGANHSTTCKQQAPETSPKESNNLNVEESPPDWSESFLRRCKPVSGNLLFVCCITPFFGSLIPFDKFWARMVTSMALSFYHIFVAVGVGWYILLAATRPDKTKVLSSILSAPQWKPISRLSLCAMLINVEVMSYLFGSREQLYEWNAFYLMSVNLYTIVVVHLCSVVVSVLFESPITAALNHLLAFASKKLFLSERKAKTKIA